MVEEGGATTTPNPEVAFLLAAVRSEVARSSVRAVARATQMSHGGVYNLLNGKTRRVYGSTVAKLRAWYLRVWAADGRGLTPEIAAYLMEQFLGDIPSGERAGAAQDVVRSLEQIYVTYGAAPPLWLRAALELWLN